jgi:hypothetical protein
MIPHLKEFKKIVSDVFDPKFDEKICIVFDNPVNSNQDNDTWNDRRNLAFEWFEVFKSFSNKFGFEVSTYDFVATGLDNKSLSDQVLLDLEEFNLIIALTEYSITSSLVSLVRKYPKRIRCASMPGAERRMHNSVYLADYKEIKAFAHSLKDLLYEAVSACVHFSTSDELFLDLRNRISGFDDGDCTRPGSLINFPSGEGFIAPYEATDDEIERFGKSNTHGVIPFFHQGEIVKGMVKDNRFIDFKGSSIDTISSLNSYFNANPSRRNIAELGLGCNPKAQVLGNRFEDEKAGVHIAYGMSSHLGGKVASDVHFDLVFAKGCPVEAEQVTLVLKDGSSVDIVQDSRLRYELLSD